MKNDWVAANASVPATTASSRIGVHLTPISRTMRRMETTSARMLRPSQMVTAKSGVSMASGSTTRWNCGGFMLRNCSSGASANFRSVAGLDAYISPPSR
jgi:hypothetical protein